MYVSGEVSFVREGTGAERTLVMEIGKEWRHDDLVVVAAVFLFTEGAVFERVGPGSIVLLSTRVELVKFVTGKGGDAKEGLEEDFRVFVVGGENGIDGEQGEQDVDDSQCG